MCVMSKKKIRTAVHPGRTNSSWVRPSVTPHGPQARGYNTNSTTCLQNAVLPSGAQ
jgi:hypothetical protein